MCVGRKGNENPKVLGLLLGGAGLRVKGGLPCGAGSRRTVLT